MYIPNTYLSPNTRAHTYLRTPTHRGCGPARGSCAQSKFIYDTSLSDYAWSLCLVWCHSGRAVSVFFPQNSRLSLLAWGGSTWNVGKAKKIGKVERGTQCETFICRKVVYYIQNWISLFSDFIWLDSDTKNWKFVFLGPNLKISNSHISVNFLTNNCFIITKFERFTNSKSSIGDRQAPQCGDTHTKPKQEECVT